MAKTETFTAACSKVGNFKYYNNFTLYVQLTDRDGNSGTNKSWVDYKVYCSSNGNGSLDSKHAIYFSINNEEKVNKTVTWTANSPYISITIAEGSIEVQHDDNGNKSIPFSASIKANNYGVSASKSGNFSLEKINRYFTSTPSISVTNRTLTSITFNWWTSETCDKIDYILSGTNKGQIWAGSATSGTLTVSGLNPNTNYSIYVWCRRQDSQLGSNSNTVWSTTFDIARITEAPNVNIGSGHTIKWNNPGGATTSLKLCKTDGSQVINYGTVTGTSKAVTPTASTIYALTPNSNSITLRYILTTTQGSYTATNYKDCVFYVTNSNPTFSNFTYQDTDGATLALTGNNQTIVKGYSNVKGIISTANKGTAKNSATMSKYRLSIGEKTAEVGYSSSAEVSTTINDVQSNSFTMYAIDSRGNSTGKTITAATYINYSPIKITSISLTRTNSVTEETTLRFSGTIWNGNFGKTSNAVTDCYYRFRETTSDQWFVLTKNDMNITPTQNGDWFSFTGKIKGDLGATGFDMDNSYIVQIFIADKLSNNYNNPATFTLGPGTPAIAIYKNNVAIGQRYDTGDGSKFQVNGKTRIKGDLSVTGNSYANSKLVAYVGSDTAATNGWYKVASQTMNDYGNTNILYYIKAGYNSGYVGLLDVEMRCHGTSVEIWECKWLVRHGFDRNDVRIVVNGMTWTLYVYNPSYQYGRVTFSEIQHLGIGHYKQFPITYYNSTTRESSAPTATKEATEYIGFKSANGRTHTGYGNHNNYAPDISFLSYWNGAYDSNNASNLVYCHEGPIQSKPTTLYDNASGTNGTVTLSQSATNFPFLEIFYRDSDKHYNSVKIASPNGKEAWLSGGYIESNASGNVKYKNVTVSGTSITSKNYIQVAFNGRDIINNNYIYITKVVGYK